MTILEILTVYRAGILSGLAVTLRLCLIIWLAGLLIGSALGAAGSRWRYGIGIPLRMTSFIMSGIPVLVFLFWMHYPLQAMLGIIIDPFYTAAAALALVNIFAVSDLVRGVLLDFPEQYLTAARVCGMSRGRTLLRIQLPIVIRQLLPGLLILQVNMLQATLFASLISVNEIFRVAQRINATIYRPIEIYTCLGMFFLLICVPLNGFALWFKKRFTRNLSDY